MGNKCSLHGFTGVFGLGQRPCFWRFLEDDPRSFSDSGTSPAGANPPYGEALSRAQCSLHPGGVSLGRCDLHLSLGHPSQRGECPTQVEIRWQPFSSYGKQNLCGHGKVDTILSVHL